MNNDYRRQLQEAYQQGYCDQQRYLEEGGIGLGIRGIKGIGRGIKGLWDYFRKVPTPTPRPTPRPSVIPGIRGKGQWQRFLENLPGGLQSIPSNILGPLLRYLRNPSKENLKALQDAMERFGGGWTIEPGPGGQGLRPYYQGPYWDDVQPGNVMDQIPGWLRNLIDALNGL